MDHRRAASTGAAGKWYRAVTPHVRSQVGLRPLEALESRAKDRDSLTDWQRAYDNRPCS